MKRYASPDPASELRRLRLRRYHGPLRPQFPLLEVEDCRTDDPDKLNSTRLNRLCREYNQFMPLGQYQAARDRDSKIARAGFAFQGIVQDVSDIIEEARQKVKTKCDELQYCLDDFIHLSSNCWPSTSGTDYLLGLDYLQLQDFIEHMKVDDEIGFWGHVVATIKVAAEGNTTAEEQLGFAKASQDQQYYFLDKVLLLMQQIWQTEHFDKIFPALITLKSVYRNGKLRFKGGSQRVAHRRIDAMIYAIIAKVIPAGSRVDDPEPDAANDKHLDHANHDYVQIGSSQFGPVVAGCGYFWNFSLALRILRPAYLDKSAAKADHLCRLNENNSCFHSLSLPMLGWLQRKAWSEVRAKVLLTAGAVLPSELIERVFEYAIEAECIPTDPRVKEVIMVDHPDCLDAEPRIERNITGPRPLQKIKQEYLCAGLVENSPEAVFLT